MQFGIVLLSQLNLKAKAVCLCTTNIDTSAHFGPQFMINSNVEQSHNKRLRIGSFSLCPEKIGKKRMSARKTMHCTQFQHKRKHYIRNKHTHMHTHQVFEILCFVRKSTKHTIYSQTVRRFGCHIINTHTHPHIYTLVQRSVDTIYDQKK